MRLSSSSSHFSWASLVAQWSRICLQCRRHRRCGFDPWVGKIPSRESMETYSTIPAWRLPWTEEPSGLQSIGSQAVRHNWIDWAHTHTHSLFSRAHFFSREPWKTFRRRLSFFLLATIYIKPALTYRRYLGLCLWLMGVISGWEVTSTWALSYCLLLFTLLWRSE